MNIKTESKGDREKTHRKETTDRKEKECRSLQTKASATINMNYGKLNGFYPEGKKKAEYNCFNNIFDNPLVMYQSEEHKDVCGNVNGGYMQQYPNVETMAMVNQMGNPMQNMSNLSNSIDVDLRDINNMGSNLSNGVQGNLQPLQTHIQNNMSGNISNNMQSNMETNIQNNIQNNLHNLQNTIQNNIQNNIQRKIHNNIHNNIEIKMPDVKNMRNNMGGLVNIPNWATMQHMQSSMACHMGNFSNMPFPMASKMRTDLPGNLQNNMSSTMPSNLASSIVNHSSNNIPHTIPTDLSSTIEYANGPSFFGHSDFQPHATGEPMCNNSGTNHGYNSSCDDHITRHNENNRMDMAKNRMVNPRAITMGLEVPVPRQPNDHIAGSYMTQFAMNPTQPIGSGRLESNLMKNSDVPPVYYVECMFENSIYV